MLGQYADVDMELFALAESECALDLRTPPWLTLLHGAAAAYAHARSGNAGEARRYLGWIVPPLSQLDPRTINQSGALFFAGAAAWELGEGTHAASIRRAACDVLASDVADYTPASSDLTAARAAALLGDLSEARASFARARTALEARGQRALLAIVDYDEATVLRKTEREAAARLLEAARPQFAELEMTGWLERADALLLSLRGAYPAGLTPREVQVLTLLAGGSKNKAIAAELVLSVHTVERHVATIYRKIGAKNRADATSFAHTHGVANT